MYDKNGGKNHRKTENLVCKFGFRDNFVNLAMEKMKNLQWSRLSRSHK
jgi:hypothetical protein